MDFLRIPKSSAIDNKNNHYKLDKFYLNMARIHLIDGEKGGVGKSLFARVMVQYCIDKNQPYILVDADRTNPDVKKFYPENAQETVFSEALSKSHEADIIFELARKENKPVIVNLPAQVYPLVTNWIKKGRLLEIADQYGVDVCKWFISNGGYDSVELFKKSLSDFGEKLPHIFVQNKGMTEEWGFLDSDGEYLELKQKYKKTMQVIEFPLLYPGDRYYIDSKNLSFDAARNSDDMPIMSQQRMHTFLEETYWQIELTEMLAPSKQPKKKEKDATKESTPANA